MVSFISITTGGRKSVDQLLKVKKEGDHVILRCNYSTTESSNYLYWYRHSIDKQPAYTVEMYSSNENPVKATGFGNRISAQLQKFSSSTSLFISGLVVSDSAVYYCAFSLTTVIDCTAGLVQKLTLLSSKVGRGSTTSSQMLVFPCLIQCRYEDHISQPSLH
uniref:Ig-like domain-containing protein n=1 Tax=Callorhinchus milii TaxID=7868 RepID=A0A4W3HY18_CALMI